MEELRKIIKCIRLEWENILNNLPVFPVPSLGSIGSDSSPGIPVGIAVGKPGRPSVGSFAGCSVDMRPGGLAVGNSGTFSADVPVSSGISSVDEPPATIFYINTFICLFQSKYP